MHRSATARRRDLNFFGGKIELLSLLKPIPDVLIIQALTAPEKGVGACGRGKGTYSRGWGYDIRPGC